MATRPGSLPDHLPYLLRLHGPGERRPLVLDRDAFTVGRARGCDLCLDASDVSTIHCLLFRGPRAYHARDCNSRTGTRINGEAVRGVQQLTDGDILQVGPFSFIVHVPRRLSNPDLALPNPVQIDRLEASRRRLAGHALRLRRQLWESGATGAPAAEVQQELARMAELARVSERRLHDLNEADRELDADREQLQTRVQTVERELAARLEQADQQIRERWQEFQRRCHAEEARATAAGPNEQVAAAPARTALEQQLAQQRQALQVERQELERMKQQLDNEQTALRTQRAELARMIDELRTLQQELRQPIADQLATLAAENEQLHKATAELQAQLAHAIGHGGSARELKEARAESELLRMLLQDRERELTDALEQLTAAPKVEAAGAPAELEALRAENDRLQERLAQQQAATDELRAKALPRPAKSANELESYEAELTLERQELERERVRLNAELEQLRVRNDEMDEATREMEMAMSRERAEMARERMRMDRMREELKQDMEKLQREMGVRESLANVQRLREEMHPKKPAGKADPAAERLRHLRHNDTPRS